MIISSKLIYLKNQARLRLDVLSMIIEKLRIAFTANVRTTQFYRKTENRPLGEHGRVNIIVVYRKRNSESL